ncbi:hypothetical protein [Pleomorphochaeta sp. DL1XJH-081]|uniref:hypothetical protein n=1 Tax=Pleomorphochaeta sp. DL1XJH-081 TaxID=3409690 RepID=UPI003BB7BBCA
MKTKIKFSILLLIVITSLLFYSCNTENEGVFVRISNSQVKVEVGYVDIIGKNATDIFAYTSEKGFQKFNLVSKDWIDVDTTVSYPGLYSSDDATDTTTLYYAESAAEGENNNLYTYTISTDSESVPTSAYEIVEMKQDNLMLVKTTTGYSIRDGAATSEIVPFNSIFSDSTKPRMITDDSGNFIVTGIGSGTTTYKHYYNSTPNELTSTDATFHDYPMVTMMSDGTNIVLVSSIGKVWKGTTAYNNFVSTGTIPGWPERNPADLEYPTFIFAAPTSELYLQNENNDFYKINSTGDISSELDSGFTDFLSGIRIKSYLEAGSTIYAGTMENGIVQITMTGSGTGSAVIL